MTDCHRSLGRASFSGNNLSGAMPCGVGAPLGMLRGRTSRENGHACSRAFWSAACALSILLLASATPALADPPAAPVPAPPAAPTSAPANAPWSVKDTHGTALAIPADKPSLLVFLRPGQEQTQDEIKLLAATLKDRTDIQIIAILSGDDAPQNSAKLAADPTWAATHWPIVQDADYASSGKFGIHVWPTTLVISPAGETLAHLAGLPATLENDLPAYLDFATKKIDRAALDKRLADRQVVTDSQAQKAARHVEVAQRLAAQGMFDDAKKELANALALGPKDPNVLLLVARTDLVIGDAKAAQALLAKLTADGAGVNFPPLQINLLKGWCAVLLENWDEARAILSENEKLNPDPAETDYLLGRVYQHDGDTKKAADYFRKAFEHSALGKSMGAQ